MNSEWTESERSKMLRTCIVNLYRHSWYCSLEKWEYSRAIINLAGIKYADAIVNCSSRWQAAECEQESGNVPECKMTEGGAIKCWYV